MNDMLAKAEWTWGDVEQLPQDLAVIITNPQLPDCPIVFANDAFLDHSGYERSEILGRNCRFMQGKDSEPMSLSKFRKAIASSSMADIKVTNYRKDGERFINHVLLRTLKDKDSDTSLVIAIQRRVEA